MHLNGFSFYVQSGHQIVFKKAVFFESSHSPQQLLSSLKQEFNTHVPLQDNFDEVLLIYDTELYAFVPQSLFDPSYIQEYVKYTIKTFPTDYTAHDILQESGIVNVYIPFANINNYLFDRFGSFDFYHSTTLLVTSLLDYQKELRLLTAANDSNQSESSILLYNATTIYIYFEKLHFHLIGIIDDNLHICNTFTHESPDDFLYYLLFTTEQLQLDPTKFSLRLLGTISKSDAYYELAYRYVKDVQLLQPLKSYAMKDSETGSNFQKDFIILQDTLH